MASIQRTLGEGFLILCGVLSASFALKSQLLPNKFIDGGATGLSLLISETTALDISWERVLGLASEEVV